MNGDHASFLAELLPVLEAAGLTIARPLGFLTLFPVFAWMGLQGMIRNAVALMIGSPMLAQAYAEVVSAAGFLPPEYLMVLMIKEFLIGAVLGVILGSPFWAAEAAGAYIDVYRGTSSATVMSTGSETETLVSGAIFSIALAAIFLTLGGLRLVIGAIYDSFAIWPLFEAAPRIAGPLWPIVEQLLAKVARLAIGLAAPMLIAMFMAELALALASRFAQQINVFDTSLSAKNIVFLLVLPTYLALLATYYAPQAVDVPGLMAIIEGAFK